MLKNNCLLEINTEVFKGGVIGYLGFILRLQQQKLNWERGIVKQNQQTIDNNYCRVMVTQGSTIPFSLLACALFSIKYREERAARGLHKISKAVIAGDEEEFFTSIVCTALMIFSKCIFTRIMFTFF